MADSVDVAFALGGLGGNNAHGAGFLQAALDTGVRPLMISCTSGQILWTYRYLCCLGNRSLSLRKQLEDDIARIDAYHNPDLDLAALAWLGKSGVFRPAGTEFVADFIKNAGKSWGNILSDGFKAFLSRRFLEMIPCRQLIPDFPPEFFGNIAMAFSASKIGVAFNSYSPTDGYEYVYLNDAARDFLHEKGEGRAYDPGQESKYRPRRIYRDISAEGVREALWLYQYGFPTASGVNIDAAYFRDIILSELTPANRIYVVRPMHFKWTGDLPQSWPEMEDLKTKIAFNGAYAGEREQIYLINHMLKSGKLNHNKKYHHIDLVEIEQSKPRGFFGYVFEDMDVFEKAAIDAHKQLAHGADKDFKPGSAPARHALPGRQEREAAYIAAPEATKS